MPVFIVSFFSDPMEYVLFSYGYVISLYLWNHMVINCSDLYKNTQIVIEISRAVIYGSHVRSYELFSMRKIVWSMEIVVLRYPFMVELISSVWLEKLLSLAVPSCWGGGLFRWRFYDIDFSLFTVEVA